MAVDKPVEEAEEEEDDQGHHPKSLASPQTRDGGSASTALAVHDKLSTSPLSTSSTSAATTTSTLLVAETNPSDSTTTSSCTTKSTNACAPKQDPPSASNASAPPLTLLQVASMMQSAAGPAANTANNASSKPSSAQQPPALSTIAGGGAAPEKNNPKASKPAIDEVAHAIQTLLQQAAAASKRHPPRTKSIDDQVIHQRNRKGLAMQPAALRKMKHHELSQFQRSQLTTTQKRLLLTMLVSDEPPLAQSTGASHGRFSIRKMDQLTRQQPKKTPPAHGFARLDDARNCHFKPRTKNQRMHGAPTKTKQRQDDDNDDARSQDGGDAKDADFIRRMEATEKARQDQLRRIREEKAYMQQIDKKECRNCGNPQSYAELTQKRKKCPNCGMLYKRKLAWGDFAQDFLERHQQIQQAKAQWLAQQKQLQEEAIADQMILTKRVLDRESHCIREVKVLPKRWHDVEMEFLGRMELDWQQRQLAKQSLEEKCLEECTFAPEITPRAKQLDVGDFEERMQRDIENRQVRLQQLQLLQAPAKVPMFRSNPKFTYDRLVFRQDEEAKSTAATTTPPASRTPRGPRQHAEEKSHRHRDPKKSEFGDFPAWKLSAEQAAAAARVGQGHRNGAPGRPAAH